jgi:UDP-3-O-[3-hydroxymyristoyl] glucosamine N-acyltransferase
VKPAAAVTSTKNGGTDGVTVVLELGVGETVAVGDSVGSSLRVDEGVCEGVAVTVALEVCVGEGVGEGAAVSVGEKVLLGVGVCVGEAVRVGDAVSVAEGVSVVLLGVALAVGVGQPRTEASTARMSSSIPTLPPPS